MHHFFTKLALWQDGADTGAGEGTSMPSDPSELLQAGKNWLAENGPDMAIKLVSALLIFVIGRWIARLVCRMVRKLLQSRNVDSTLIGFLTSMLSMLLTLLIALMAIGTLGVDTTSFAAIIAAAGLAIGFALQGSLSNFAAGVMIIFFKPFKAGDFVEAAGVSGAVEEIQIFCTIMKTPDNKRIIVPNGSITADNITNYSANDTRRVDLKVGISYGDDIRKAKQVLEEVVGKDERVLKDPAPVVAVTELGDSSVNLIVRPWVKTADYWAVYWALTENIKLALDDQGISIPFPQRDVHLFQEAAA